jgi:uncharacterized secreted protein with C-terminal beta-propeller domain
MKSIKAKGTAGIGLALLIIIVVSAFIVGTINPTRADELPTFNSCGDLAQAFDTSMQQGYMGRGILETAMPLTAAADASIGAGTKASSAPDHSTTNIQVAGVDEADIVKTDGDYIYTISFQNRNYRYFEDDSGSESDNMLVIAKAWPAEDAEILSRIELDSIVGANFNPTEMFIDGDRLLLFGSKYEEIPIPEPLQAATPQKVASGVASDMIYPYPYRVSVTSVNLLDISDRSNPELVRTIDFEGSYLSSRKIGADVYFVVNAYPNIYAISEAGNITEEVAATLIPVYKDSASADSEYKPSCGCVDVSYFEPIQAQNFISIISIPMDDDDGEITKEVIVGSGENIYASLDNLFVAESVYPYWGIARTLVGDTGPGGEITETTVVHKFNLEDGKISYEGNGEVPGHILNQFSMDEYNDHFRIATTIGHVSRMGGATSTNNIYILNSDMTNVGKIEDIAPGEQIYSARFMGDRGYLVTFKKVDPFFVIDLSNPMMPQILGKLKIPGYSDYLHPYDENHIIGIGKEAVEAEESRGDFAWYQGVKMAVFDVTDVSNPVEMHKVIIGDRGTDSEVLNDHKAFLFDADKNLLVLPITLAEIEGDKEALPPNTYGDFVFQGAYVYSLTLGDGFNLMGRITHYDNDEAFKKSGYYFGDYGSNVRRSLYIGNALYTTSNSKIMAHSLLDLSEIAELIISG